MNWRRTLLVGMLVGGSIWCLGLVQQVHSEQVDPDPSHPRVQAPAAGSGVVVEAAKPAADHPGISG